MQQVLVERGDNSCENRNSEIKHWDNFDEGAQDQTNDGQSGPEKIYSNANFSEILDYFLWQLRISQNDAEKGRHGNDRKYHRSDCSGFFQTTQQT